MIRTYIAGFCSAALLVTVTGQVNAGPLLGGGGGSGPSTLTTIDTSSGLVSNVGPTGFSSVIGIDFDSTGTLFGVANATQQLVTIDTDTGNATAVTPTNLGNPGVFGIAFDEDDNLFAVSLDGVGNSYLATINTTTGVVSGIGFLGGGYTSYDISFDSNGTLYGVDFFTGVLLTIDPNTGVATSVGGTGFIGLLGLAFDDDGTLYGTEIGTFQLLTINPSTAAATPVGPLGELIPGGLTSQTTAVPEPTSLALLAMGALGMVGYRWRHCNSGRPDETR